MTTRIALLGKIFNLRSAKAGEVERFPFSDKPDGGHFRYQIYVYLPAAQRSIKFMYFTSTYDYQHRKEIDEAGLKTAFYNFLSDVYAGYMDYEYFCREFGYEPRHKNSKRIYAAVQKSAEKWRKLDVGTSTEFYDAFQEQYPDLI